MSCLYSTEATRKRLTQTGDKSAYGAVSGTVLGYFSPADPDTHPEAASLGVQGYTFACGGDEDVRITDILTIDSKDYAVRGIRRFKGGGIDNLDILLELSVKK